MKILELVIDEEAEVYGIEALSLVEFPAIESDWVAMKDATNKVKVEFAEVDNDKRILMGAALIPDKPIYRRDLNDEEYYVYFSKATVRRCMEMFFSYGNQNNATLEHEHPLRGLSVVESWIVEDKDKDKTAMYDLDVPLGTWMVSVKVDNEAIWNEWVKEGKVKGFSIEGFFVDRMEVKEKEEAMAKSILASYSDYPEAVKNSARRVLRYTEKNGWGSCGTQVGKVRANQLANGEKISVETIKRMKSYLERHAGDLDSSKEYGDGCGKLMYDSWGGKSALRWAKSKLNQLDLMTEISILSEVHKTNKK